MGGEQLCRVVCCPKAYIIRTVFWLNASVGLYIRFGDRMAHISITTDVNYGVFRAWDLFTNCVYLMYLYSATLVVYAKLDCCNSLFLDIARGSSLYALRVLRAQGLRLEAIYLVAEATTVARPL